MSDSEFFKNSAGYYVAGNLSSGLTVGCTGRSINRIDYGMERSDIRKSEKKLLNGITGLYEKDILFLEQVHGSEIIPVDEKPQESSLFHGTADAMVTSISGICLVIRTADCVPVLLVDEKRKVIGAAHSGWKGTQLNISGALVSTMKERHGCEPSSMKAYILPSIGPDSYEVNQDVAQFFPAQTIRRGTSLYVNLWACIESSLKAEGIPAENIFNTEICNRKNTGEFFSHRFGDNGRNLNFIFYKE